MAAPRSLCRSDIRHENMVSLLVAHMKVSFVNNEMADGYNSQNIITLFDNFFIQDGHTASPGFLSSFGPAPSFPST
jgi:hypothetical protein